MKKKITVMVTMLLLMMVAVGSVQAAEKLPPEKTFDQTDGVLDRARSIEDIEYKIMVQRATQGAIYYMPAVVMVDFVKAIRRDLGGDLNDVAYLNAPLGSDDGFLTANDVTAYAWASLSSSRGPIIVEVPPATDKVSYFGSILNAWSQPIEDVGPAGRDKGRGGKYLLLPPGYDGETPKSELEKDGYFVYETDTYEYGFSFRPRLYNNATDKDAGDYAKGVKIYYLSEAANPPPTNHLNATEKSYDCLPYYNYTFFQDMDHVVQNNPIRTQDKAMVSLLKDLGIVKGKPYEPTERQRKAMHEGLLLAYASMQKYFVTPGKSMEPLWKDKNGKPKAQWMFWLFGPGQPEAGFTHETETEILVDDRAAKYFYVTYLPRYLGGGTFYLTGLFDSHGDMYDGKSTYKLNVPKDTPAKDFWSVIVYSLETKNFIRDVDRVGLSSRNADAMQINDDGSCDVYFAPEAPEGKESNWIPTGEDFFLLFRLYGPESKDFYKTWMLGDLEKIN
ncbi:DUF1214 domain-containing protein [Desulfoluna spongiiphila]|uniref:Uncharacterized conserved protein n=1 Tax=Desulfoluna spongiiphila TaxID=419481 RepID=A0A1G5E8R3_9BACT|nr:DUF1214 domain-containing protein [Desulfoluna spongiiphila]SCY23295.1 Uncharacterized conserved protein [Desulfoluna spongiiphila]